VKPGAAAPRCVAASTFSILERIDVGETLFAEARKPEYRSFSILERIDVGETRKQFAPVFEALIPFSILERIDVGETPTTWRGRVCNLPSFSILERIDVGETFCSL